jgi:hypothetical protein
MATIRAGRSAATCESTRYDTHLFDGSLRNNFSLEFIGPMRRLYMPSDLKPNEWNLLKHQFDALVHDESVGADSIETIFDNQFRRRFAELINRAADRHSRTPVGPSLKRRSLCDGRMNTGS